MPHARVQKNEFFKGRFLNTCGLGPCYARNWTGPPAP